MTQSSTPFPLGAMVGGPNGSAPAASQAAQTESACAGVSAMFGGRMRRHAGSPDARASTSRRPGMSGTEDAAARHPSMMRA